MTPEDYLRQVEARLCGSRSARKRLLSELRDHFEDAAEAGVGPAEVVSHLGAPEDVAAPWRAHAVAVRGQDRRRAAVLTLAVATTVALGIAQHASGHRTPRTTCAHQHASQVECPRASSQSGSASVP